MNLVDGGFAGLWKKYSVVALALIVAVQQVWGMIPPELQQSLGPNTLQWVTTVLGVLGIVGRAIKQTTEGESP